MPDIEHASISSTPIALVVAGAPRSGTSALTGLLTILGCTPPSDLQRATRFNPKGYFESEALIAFFDRVLAAQGSSELDWRPLKPEWANTPAADRLLEEGASLLLKTFGGASLIALKNPRIAKIIPFTTRMLERAGYQARYVLAVRNPVEVARSEVLHHELSLREAELVWLRYMLDAERGSRQSNRVFVDFHQTLRDWRGVAAAIERHLDISLVPISSDVAARAEQLITMDLWRQRESRAAATALASTPWVKPTYEALRSLQNDPHCSLACGALDVLAREFSWAVETFSPMVSARQAGIDEWTPYMPFVQSSSGRLGEVEAGGRYRVDGKAVFVNFKVLIKANGNAGDVLSFSLPESYPARAPTALIGRERTRGSILQGIIDEKSLSVFMSDNTYPGFDGAEITLSGLYEAA